MKKARLSSTPGRRTDVFVSSPGYPKTVSEVIRCLKNALEKAERLPGQELTQKETATLIGAPKSTLHDWYHGSLAAPIKHFLCGVERLSEAQRTELFRGLCRACPRLDHPRLADNAEALASLRAIIDQGTGLVLVTGSSEELQTFVFTAIGNSAAQMFPLKSIFGFDVHTPDSWVPIPGVLYFQNPKNTAEVTGAIRGHWSRAECSSAEIILLNSVWTIVPECRQQSADLALRKLVIVADGFASGEGRKGKQWNANIIEVSAGQADRIRLRVSRGLIDEDKLHP